MAIEIVPTDKVYPIRPPAVPDYRQDNPLNRLLGILEEFEPAAERECYLADSIQHLIAYDFLELYGPSGEQWDVTDPRAQPDTIDFQKQNFRDFRCTDTRLARGWATVEGWIGAFLLLSYRGGPDSALAVAAGRDLGSSIQLRLKVGALSAPELLSVPYNPRTHRYELEIWSYPGNDLRAQLDVRGKAAYDRGGLIARPAFLRGAAVDFAREGLDNRDMRTVAPDSAMHPVLPLAIQAAWADASGSVWDPRAGANYRYVFSMPLRGWNNFLKVGVSERTHGGFGFLHFRNLFSNYFEFAESSELARELEPWMFNAEGARSATLASERFMALQYLDIHYLKGGGSIGLHRHRSNQEIVMALDGSGLMVFGDWCQFPNRERCFEVRTLKQGSMTLIKPGQLHALFNVTDQDLSLLMFGGYD